MTLSTVSSSLSFYGPPIKSGSPGRSKFKFSANNTASYIPSCLLNSRDLRGPVEKICDYRPVCVELIQDLVSDIDNHVEMRLQLFLLQLLLSYRTGIIHESCQTDQQVGSGTIDYHATHASTLPALKSCKDKQEPVRFLKGSYFYDAQNATILLPEVVNGIDSRIDRFNRKLKVKEALRKIALRILNQVSDGSRCPFAGLHEFIKQFLCLVNQGLTLCHNELKGASKMPHKERLKQEQLILGRYKKIALSYLNQEETIIKQFCFAFSLEINQRYYLEVQSELYKTLGADVSKQPFIQKAVLNLLSIARPPTNKTLNNTALKYVEICLLSDAIRIAVKNYFSSTAEDVVSRDFECLPLICKYSTRSKYELSESIVTIWQQARCVVRKKYSVSDPQNMGMILINIFQTIHSNPF
jgi:hypothetical protein